MLLLCGWLPICAQSALQLLCWLLQLLQQAMVLLGQPQLLLTVFTCSKAGMVPPL
jgi:hypothetical protein